MIDPLRVTNFERTLHEAEEFLAFVILGAGKDSDRAAAATADLLRGKPASLAPYAWLRRLGRNRIAGRLVASRFGQQHQKSKYLHGTAVLVADRDVRDVRDVRRSTQAEGVVPATCPIGWLLEGRRRTTAYSDQQADQPEHTSANIHGRSPTKFPS